MKTHLLAAFKLTLATLVLFAVVYPLVLFGVAQLAPNGGKGEIIEADGKRYYANIGQAFTADRYFHSRPSAVGYNAAGSGASNKGPSNANYLAVLHARIDTFLVHNPDVSKSRIPVELVTTSGSGLDPHISPKAARVQAERISAVRNVTVETLETLITEHTEKPLLGMMGPEKINVLKLNLALDALR